MVALSIFHVWYGGRETGPVRRDCAKVNGFTSIGFEFWATPLQDMGELERTFSNAATPS